MGGEEMPGQERDGKGWRKGVITGQTLIIHRWHSVTLN